MQWENGQYLVSHPFLQLSKQYTRADCMYIAHIILQWLTVITMFNSLEKEHKTFIWELIMCTEQRLMSIDALLTHTYTYISPSVRRLRSSHPWGGRRRALWNEGTSILLCHIISRGTLEGGSEVRFISKNCIYPGNIDPKVNTDNCNLNYGFSHHY